MNPKNVTLYQDYLKAQGNGFRGNFKDYLLEKNEIEYLEEMERAEHENKTLEEGMKEAEKEIKMAKLRKIERQKAREKELLANLPDEPDEEDLFDEEKRKLAEKYIKMLTG